MLLSYRVLHICWLPFLLCFLFPQKAAAQYTDNLLLQPQYTLADTLAISNLLKQGNDIQQQLPDSSLVLYDKAYRLSKEKGYTDGIIRALYYSARLNTQLFRPEKAIALYHTAIFYTRYSNHLKYELIHNLGVQYGITGEYKKAAQCFYNAIKESQRLHIPPDSKEVVSTYINLSSVKNRSGDGVQTLKYADYALEIARRKHYLKELASALSNKGGAYEILGENDSALQYYKEALNLAIQIKDSQSILEKYIHIGVFFLNQNKENDAISFLKKGEIIASKMTQPVTYRILKLWNALGLTYYQFKDCNIAEKYLLESLKLSDKSGIIQDIDVTYKTLAEIYEATNRPAEALTYFHLYKRMQDSLLSKEKTKDINELEIKYRTAEKDKMLAQKELEISRQQTQLQQKNLWITGAVSGILILLLLATGLYYRYRNKQKFQLQQWETDKLKSMIEGEERERERIAHDLHDGIGGMLASLNMHVSAVQKRYRMLFNSPELEPIMEMIENTTQEVRKTAHNLMPDMLMRHSFTEAIRLYCEQVNSAKGLHINLFFVSEIALQHKPIELVLYRILQELIQNIVKHAEATEAVVEIEQTHDTLKIIVEDNGKGFDIRKIKEGFGLQHLQHRVKSLQGEITIESAPDKGTTVNMSFDISALKNIIAYEHQDSNNG